MDLGSAPVLPEPGDLFAGVHQPIGDAGVDEAALHRHTGSQGKRGDHPADGLGQPHRLTEGVVTAQTGVAVDQPDQVDGGDAENRTSETVVEAGDQRREVTAKGDRCPLSPIIAPGCCEQIPGQQAPDIPHRLSRTVDVVEHVLTGERDARRAVPRARGPCMGSTGSTTLRPRSECRCQARNSMGSSAARPISAPCTHTSHGRGWRWRNISPYSRLLGV